MKSFHAVAPRGNVHALERPASSDTVLLWLAGLFIVACALFGGDTPVRLLPFIAIAITGTALLGASLYFGGLSALTRLTPSAQCLILLFLLLPWLQLIPLPPALWRVLPGREVAAAVIDTIGWSDAWRPITLDFAGTMQAAAAFLWLSGLLLAIITLPLPMVRTLFKVVVGLGFLNILIGFLQFSSKGAQFNFYNSSHDQFLLGFFSNKNHTALFLAITILACATLLSRKRSRSVNFLFASSLILIFAGLFATFSRAGLLLGFVAVGFVVTMNLRLGEGRRRFAAALIAVGVIAAASLFMLSNVVEQSVGRFSAIGEDVRLVFWEHSWPMVATYFPAGGGLSTFATLFRVEEQLEWIRPTYLNHAHNDYIELLIEAGALGVLLVGLTLWILARSVYRAWLVRKTLDGRYALIGGAIALLCMLHSIVDYPLRRLAIAAPFILGYGIAIRMQMRVWSNEGSQNPSEVVAPRGVSSGLGRSSKLGH